MTAHHPEELQAVREGAQPTDAHDQAAMRALIQAIDQTQAVVEFDLDGLILSANEIFLNTMGYHRAELLGQHHGVLCDASFAAGEEHQQFWDSLRLGLPSSGEFKRMTRQGRPQRSRRRSAPALPRCSSHASKP